MFAGDGLSPKTPWIGDLSGQQGIFHAWIPSIAVFLVVLLFLLPFATAASPPPNFVIILADDLGYGDLGCYGAKDVRTPHLDRMASQGLRLTSFYAQPICGPSRAALMTGCYPLRIAEPGNRKSGHTVLHPREVTLAEVLAGAGYRTAIVGKWHLGMGAGSRPYEQGFEHAYFTPAFNGASREIRPGTRFPFLREDGTVARTIGNQQQMDTLTQDCTREACEFLRAVKGRPFFLYLALHMPHVPLGATAAFRQRSARGLYGDVVEELDWSVGEVLATLDALGLHENTIVFFTSDNGPWRDPQIGDHGGSAGPLRGAKMTTWEGGWRVPAIVRWPGSGRVGKTTDDIASTLDLLPTFANLAGAELPGVKLDGVDLSKFLTAPGARSPRDTFLYHNGARLTAVRHRQWKLVFARPAGGQMPWAPAFVTSHIEALPSAQLFNLDADRGETKDVAAEHPDIVQALERIAEASRAQLGDYHGPGKGARFFDEGPRWPRPTAAKAKAKRRDAGKE
ncbi:MAG: sulfatase [Planctomycetota bacterium]